MGARILLARCIIPLAALPVVLGCLNIDPLVTRTMLWNVGQDDGSPMIMGDHLKPEGKQAIIYGQHATKSKGDTTWAFFVMVKGRGGPIIQQYTEVVEDGEGGGAFREVISMGAKVTSVDYEIARKPFREILKIGGEVQDLQLGRVFLVDLGGKSPIVSQFQVALEAPTMGRHNLPKVITQGTLINLWMDVEGTFRDLKKTVPEAAEFGW